MGYRSFNSERLEIDGIFDSGLGATERCRGDIRASPPSALVQQQGSNGMDILVLA